MNQLKERFWKPAIVLSTCLNLTLLACGGTGEEDSRTAEQAVISAPGATGAQDSITCKTGGYVLCIAASCNGDGLCGVYTENGKVCDAAGVNDGSCGACYYFESEVDEASTYHSYFPDSSVQTGSTYTSCEELSSQPYAVSTYSDNLLGNFGFKAQDLSTCPTPFTTANCMGAACTATGLELPVANGTAEGTADNFPTYTCKCELDRDAVDGAYQNYPLANQPNCDATWSVG